MKSSLLHLYLPPLLLFLCITIVASSLVSFVAAQTPTGNSVCPTKAFAIAFQPITVEPRSFFTSAGQTATVTRSKKFPRIIVRAIDSNGNFDPSVNNVNVIASSNDATTTIDTATSTARMFRGEAHFDGLIVLNGDSMKLNFTSVSDEQYDKYDNGTIYKFFYPLHNKFITTGFVKVERQPIEQFALQFLRHSSAVRYPGLPMTVVSSVALPTIRLQVVQSDYTQYRPLLGPANNFSVGVGWTSPPPAGTSLSGNLQPIVSGFATFDSLVITTNEKTLPGLNFYINDPPLSVSTGAIDVDILRDSARIEFDSAESSFIFTVGQEFSGRNGAAFPKIQISVRDNMGRAASQSSGLIITASCGRGALTGEVAGVVEGVAVFDSLFFYDLTHVDLRPYVLTFTAGTQSGFRPARTSDSTLYTGIVMMSVVSYPAYRFRFIPGVADAFFNGMFIKKQVVKDSYLSPQLRVELLNSDNSRDTTTTSVSVTIALENGRFKSTDTTKPFASGVASFPDFQFTTTSTIDNSYIVLSVTNVDNAQDRIVTGRVNVTNAVSNFNLRFQPYGAGLLSAAGQPSFATIGVAMPPIVVELVTSANAIDTSSNDITITATSSGATLTGSFVRVANGVATFRELTFVSDIPGDFKLTFTAGDAGSAPVQGKSIVTGTVTTFAAVTPNVRPRFRATDSYIQYAGQSRPMTLGLALPPIIVVLATSDHSGPQKVNGTAANILGEASLSNGAFATGATLSGLIVTDGVLVINNLRINSGLDPVLTICFRSGITSGDPPPADGQCIKSGPLRTTTSGDKIVEPTGYLTFYAPLTTLPDDGKVAKGQLIQIAIDLRNSVGARAMTAMQSLNLDFDVEATTSVQLSGTTRVAYNKSIGVALFTDLVFREDLSAGITPAITFTVQSTATVVPAALLQLLPISSQLLSIQGANANSGVDVVAEIFTDYLTFDADGWKAKAARRLNVEAARIQRLRVFRGKSADPVAASVLTEDAKTARPPSWSGTRFDMRFLPPLATSRDTRTAQDLADLFVNLKPSCLIGELKLRKAYYNATDISCDWYLFDAQLTSVRSCIQSKGQQGFCQCHVPLFAFMGMRCLGLARMTTLCLNILISKDAADCQQQPIVSVCSELLVPDAPRTAIAASGAVMFLCFIPIFYLYSGGFFHKINLPTAEHSRITKSLFIASDEKDLL